MTKPALHIPEPGPPRCLTCYYVLTGLPDPRCPECGREFVPGIEATFTLELLPGNRTKLTLETVYIPLLTPRGVWYPFESYAVHTFHSHVMEGMRRKAEGLDKGSDK